MVKSPGNSSRAGQRQLKVRLRNGKRRKASSRRWLERQLKDPYVVAAQREGLRSRAAYKLIEIDDKYHILKPGQRVVDLGAAPGGWSQVAAKRVMSVEGRGQVVADELDRPLRRLGRALAVPLPGQGLHGVHERIEPGRRRHRGGHGDRRRGVEHDDVREQHVAPGPHLATLAVREDARPGDLGPGAGGGGNGHERSTGRHGAAGQQVVADPRAAGEVKRSGD